ncbi:MAG TPA: YfhO family protein [bacterium]
MRAPGTWPRQWGPLALVVLAAALFFAPYLLQGKVFLAGDALYQHVPWGAYAPPGFRAQNTLITDPVNANFAGLYNHQLTSGWPAQWNPYLLTGLPATDVTSMSGAPGRAYPVKLLLHRFLTPTDAFMWGLILHVAAMGAFMYLYLREVGAEIVGALFGAVVYMFNGCVMVWLEFESVPYTAAFLPLLLLFMERTLRPRGLRYGFAGALVLGTMALMGMIQYLIYAGLLAGFYALFLMLRAHLGGQGRAGVLRVAACFAITCAGGALISAVGLLPDLDLIRHSSRVARAFTFSTFFDTLARVPFRYLVTLVFPDFFGSPPLGMGFAPRLPTQEYMNYNELCIYLGVPTLVGVLAALAAPKNAAGRFHLGALAVLLALLTGTVLYYPFFALVPGMDRMNPTRLAFLFMFAGAAAAGLGVSALGRLEGRRRTLFLSGAAALAALGALVAFAGATPGWIRWFDREAAAMPYAIEGLARLRRPFSALILRPLLLLLASVGLGALAVLARDRRARLAGASLLVALLVYDLTGFGWGYNAIVPAEQVYPRTPSIDFLQRQPGPFRVLLDGSRGLLVNTMAPFEIQEVGGYSSFYPERVGKLLSFIRYGQAAFSGARFDRWIVFGGPGPRLFDLLNVRYVLTAPGSAIADPRFRLAHRSDMDIYENLSALPRAFAVHRAVVRPDPDGALAYLGSEAFDMRGEVVLERDPDPAFRAGVGAPTFAPRVATDRYEPDAVALTAELSTAGWLVLTDSWYPGWRAEVDGREVPIERADYAYRAVPLPAGRHAVVFRYVSAPLRRGLALTLAGLFLVGGGLAYVLWRGRRAAAPAPPTASP